MSTRDRCFEKPLDSKAKDIFGVERCQHFPAVLEEDDL
jgi:hypothetical protein